MTDQDARTYAWRYMKALAEYLRGDNEELALSHAYELGRGALAARLSLLDLVAVHYEAARALLAEGERLAAPAGSLHKIEAFLSEALAPFEMTHRQALERTQALQDFNAELERRVTVRTAELQAANRELDAFSYSVSHDLRAPLRAVSGFSSILIRDFAHYLPEEAANYLELMRTNVHQMDRLVNDLLELSRFSRQPIRKTQVDTAQLVRECLAVLRPGADGRNVDIVVGELGTCLADPELLRQVFMNLLGNAIKYSRQRDPARVQVHAELRDDEYVVRVKDNGVGFDMRNSEKLFRVFQRLHSADDFEGTGVGLAIVARIVAKHGGRVWADAVRDRGATFYVALPEKDVERHSDE